MTRRCSVAATAEARKNTGRAAVAVEERAQMLIVAHQARTMEAKDILYGVSLARTSSLASWRNAWRT